MNLMYQFRRMTGILCLFLLIAGRTFGQDHPLTFISPKPDSRLVSRRTTLIFGHSDAFDPAGFDQSSLLVTGSTSGIHSGDWILCNEDRTLIFKPDQPFDAGEEVTVKIQRGLRTRLSKVLPLYSFTFTISPLTDYQREILLREDDTGEVQTHHHPRVKGGLALTGSDSLPDDFPKFTIHKYGDTAPGLLIGASKSSNTAVGDYRYVMDETGACLYYEKKADTKAGAFKMEFNGFLSYAAPVPGDHTYIHRIVDTTYAVVDSFQMGNGYIADNISQSMSPTEEKNGSRIPT